MRTRGRVTIWAITLGAAALVSVLVAVGLLLSTRDDAKADFPHTGVDFSIGIDTTCDSSGTPTATCGESLGAAFKVTAKLNSNGGEAMSGYDTVLNYTAGLSLVSDKPTSPPGGPLQPLVQQGSPNAWTPCGFPASNLLTIGVAAVGCGLGIGGVPATYTGPLYQINFACNGSVGSSETITLVHGDGNTSITAADGVTTHGEASGSEVLTISCLAVTDTPTPTDTVTPTLTSTPTNTPVFTPTPTPNPNPKMLLNVLTPLPQGVPAAACFGDPNQIVPSCNSMPFFSGAEKRGEFTVRVSSFFEIPPYTYGGFETQIDLESGLTYNSQSCVSEVVWTPLLDSTCSKTLTNGDHSIRLGGRTSAQAPFDGTTLQGPMVEIRVHCSKIGQYKITLRTTSGVSDPGSFFVLTNGTTQATKPSSVAGVTPDVAVIKVDCVAQAPEMSLGASGPSVSCTPGPNGKPDKCIAPFEPSGTQTPFQISVNANVLPANAAPNLDGYGGFDTEVIFGGLKYLLPKASCLVEAIWPSTLLCAQGPATVGPFKQHQIRSGLFALYPISHYTGELLRMSVTCPALGQFQVTLPASDNLGPTAGFARFLRPDNVHTTLAIATYQPLDLNGDTLPDPNSTPFGIADALLINCQVVPTATPTSTPTATATATATPCPTTGCPTATPTVTATPTTTNTVPPTSTFTPLPPTNTPVPPTFTPTITPTPTPCCEVINQTIFGPGKVSTDDENDGATGTDQVETSVTITALLGGKVTIDEEAITEPDPTGYDFFGQQVEISAPAALVPSNPISILFTLDTSIKPAGANEDTIQVFRNSIKVNDCTGPAGTASPNPCVTNRVTLSGPALGDVQLTVLTTVASKWNFGVLNGTPVPTPAGVAGDVNCDGDVGPIDAQLILQFIVGIIDFLPCPENADVNDDGEIDAIDALLILQENAGIIDGFPAGALGRD